MYPKISIITPSYNQGRFLETAIKSIINQKYPNLEYIVMDGGSTDDSIEIIKRHARNISHWESGADYGQADAIAKGIGLSNGEIVGWVNSDDLLICKSLYRVAEAFSRRKNIEVVSGRCVYIDDCGTPITVCVPCKRSWIQMLFLGHGLPQVSTFFTKKAYQQAGGIPTCMKFSFDYDLFVRLRKTHKIEIIPYYLGAFRLHSSSKTFNMISVCKGEDRLIQKKFLKNNAIFIFSDPIKRLALFHRIKNRYTWLKDKREIGKLLVKIR
jgi:glycosyltransferase involved in cell wall biosynthesis